MANETSGRRDNRVPFRASTKTPNIMMLRRTRLLLIVCGILAFAVLGIKLFSVMIIHHDEYEKMAIDQQVRETEITASRGAIYDTNGKILAMNASVDTIFISPAEIAKNNEDPQLIARELSEILDVDYDKILSMTKNTDRWYEVVKRKVEPDVSEKVRAFKKEKKLIGVKIEPDTKRYYPYGSLAAHVIGFVGQDNEGRYGLEQRYDSYLTGSTGRIIRATDNRGTDMLFVNYEDYYDETKGDDMNLTIDATIQYYLEKHLQQAVEDYDVQNGAAAIAMDPSTGAILGMVSLGNFDLNNYQKVSDKDQEAIDAETDPDKRSELLTAAQQKQWRNKALSDTYEPGSTFKIITLAMALEEGVVSESSSFYCGGSIPVLGRTDPVKCWKTTGHGSQNLTQAMQHSCNVALVQIGQLVGAFIGFYLNLTRNPDVHLRRREIRPHAATIKEIYAVGVPSIIMQSIGSVMVFGMNKILISFTEAATAVFGAYFKLQSFIFMPIFGLNNAMVPIISYNYGAGKPERFRRTIRLSAVTAIAIMCVGLALFEIIPGTLLGLFSPSEEMLTIGRTALRIIGLTFPLAGFCIVSGSVFQALGTPFYSLIVSVCRQICVLLPVAYLLSLTGRLELVWWSFPIAELVSLTLSAIFLRRTLRAAGERLSQK